MRYHPTPARMATIKRKTRKRIKVPLPLGED
jgi:hypothetical protein